MSGGFVVFRVPDSEKARTSHLWEPEELFFQQYPTVLMKCRHCGHVFEDREDHYTALGDSKILVCKKCSEELRIIQDYELEGSQEPCGKKWGWMRRLALTRDHYRCRICGDYNHDEYETDGSWKVRRKHTIEVHHIIPLRANGTNSLKNLITLCVDHHRETFVNDYAGLKITDRLIQTGTQRVLQENVSSPLSPERFEP